jgi:hypothetical protein
MKEEYIRKNPPPPKKEFVKVNNHGKITSKRVKKLAFLIFWLLLCFHPKCSSIC